MTRCFINACVASITLGTLLTIPVLAQAPEGGAPRGGPERGGRGPFGPGGRGPGQIIELNLVDRFDKDGNEWLNAEERKAAREFLAKENAEGRRARRPGPRFGRESGEPAVPGKEIGLEDVDVFPNAHLYDPHILRTLFFEFENADWEKELEEFYGSDVEVPAKLTVDGKIYEDVGVRFRGASSFFMTPEGRKRSLNISIDLAHKGQRLGSYRTLELLNSHTDPSFLRTVLYAHIAREYIPAPKANYARVVINGESWGVYINSQQFNKDFIRDNFPNADGPRWKAPGSPRGRAGLEYLGDDIAEYKRYYEIKTKDDPKSWNAFIQLCKILNETPADQLEAALEPILNIDGVLKFLALQNVFINNDGYWIRSSDYNLFQDRDGRFHIFPHDANETFRAPGGPGWSGGRVSGVELDPLTGIDDPAKPLISKLLTVPTLKTRYLGYVREIAERWLNWERLGPLARQYQDLIAADVKADTRKLDSFEAFSKSLTEDTDEQGVRGSRRSMSLKSFAEKRRDFLLSHIKE